LACYSESLRFVSWEERKEVAAEQELDTFAEKWSDKSPAISQMSAPSSL